MRLINSLDVFGKLYYKWLWSNTTSHAQRPYASGYTIGKSRLSAIVQQAALAERLRRSRWSFCQSFHDVANAFPSPSHESLDDSLRKGARPCDRELLRQRHIQACMHIEASDKDLHVRPHSGNLQGDTHAGAQFLEVYHPCVDQWAHECISSFGDELVATDPVTGCSVDVAMSTYADDVARTLLAPSPVDMLQTINRSNFLLDKALSAISLGQNVEKQEHLPFFAGAGTDDNMRRVFSKEFLPGNTRRAARYLGTLLHFKGNFNMEVSNRIQAADKSWAIMGKFWSHGRMARRPLVLMFTALVYNTLLSGLEACCLTKTHLQRIDSKVLSYGRKLMRGEACVKLVSEDGSTEFHALPSRKVWQYLELVPTSVELAVRRLQFWQAVARNIAAHTPVLAVVFGSFKWEAASPIDEAGKLTPAAGSWAQQLYADVQLLAEHDDGYILVRDMGEQPLLLFTHLREQFVRVDVTVLKRAYQSVAIPPPGSQEEPRVADVEVHGDACSYRCTCTLPDGSTCGAAFQTKQQLAMHIRSTKGGTHGEVPTDAKATVSNVCPWCRAIFASKRVARTHIRMAISKRKCSGRSSNHSFTIEHPQSLECSFCLREHENVESLLACITTHVAGPYILVP